MKRLKVRQDITWISVYSLEGSMQEIIKFVKESFEGCAKHGFFNLEMKLDPQYGEYMDYVITGERLETDKEFNKRKKEIARQKEQKLKNEKRYKEKIKKEAKKLGII